MFRRFLVGLLVLAGCSSDKPTGPATPSALALITQPATAPQSGVALSPQPVVELRDAAGNPVAAKGVLVTASLTGGGTLAGQTDVRTDATGRAAFTDLAIGGPVGPRTLRFASGALTPAISNQITLGAGAASAMAPSAGNNQTAAAGTDLAAAPAVLVTDGAGNPVSGVAVTFSVTAGGGSLQGANVSTGPNGVAAASKWTLGAVVGTNTVKAAAGALEVTFTATGTVGAPAKLVVAGGNHRTGVVAAPIDSSPAVKVLDAFDNPVPGLAVTFAVATGGGTISNPNPVSDAAGVARLGTWTLGYAGGANTLTASRPGITPVTFTATGIDYKVASIEAGDDHSCAILADGSAYCWGLNASGQIGDGGLTDDSLPTKVQGGLVFTQISGGSDNTCGVVASGEAYCWGDNTNGQLGDSTATSSSVPVKVVGGHLFKSIEVGQAHVCALTAAGAAWCWGDNGNGRLGDNTTVDKPFPVPVAGGHTFTMISAGFTHTCGLRDDGVVLCWGQGTNGRIGDGGTIDRRVPTAVAGSATYTAVSAGGAFSCALAVGGAAQCWGQGNNGAIGNGSNISVSVPTAVSGGLVFSTIRSAESHNCGLVGTDAYCWGLNTEGELGDGTRVTRNTPVKVNGQGLAFVTVTPGAEHTCFKTVGGAAFCIGRNDLGMLGTGTFTNSLVLMSVHP